MKKLLLCVSLVTLGSSSVFAANCSALSDPIAMLRCEKEKQSGGQYKAPVSRLLKCGVNVNCNSKADAVSKMRSAWMELRSAGGVAGAYASSCLSALRTIDGLNPNIRIDAGIVEPQLGACNAGLAELN